MANTEVTHLLSMANDIAANLSFQAGAEEKIADHINRFWAPRMRRLLLEHAADEGMEMHAALRNALSRLRTE
jgi:formate dehydrogenase subunit delta